MRKLFFTLAFVFVASFGFAASSVENENEISVEIVKSEFNEFTLKDFNLLELSFEYFFDCSGQAHFVGMSVYYEGGNYYEAWFAEYGRCVMREYEEAAN